MKICEWEHIEDCDGFWDTNCGVTFKRRTNLVFNGETFKDIKFIYCPNCGGKIEKI